MLTVKKKGLFFGNFRPGLALPSVRSVCLIAMACFMGKAITSGVHTLGTIAYSLFPVLFFGAILLFVESQKGVFSFLAITPTLSDIKSSKEFLPHFIIALIAGVFLVFYFSSSSPVDLMIILLIIVAAGASTILMLKGRGVDAMCVFILTWPFMVFERTGGNLVFRWTNSVNDLHIGSFSEDIVYCLYLLLLVGSWLLRYALNRERIKSESWHPGVLAFFIAGSLSALLSSIPLESFPSFINLYILPLVFFILCVNIINSWDDVKKLSLCIGIMMTVLTIIWMYYALYRSPVSDIPLAEARGCGFLRVCSL